MLRTASSSRSADPAIGTVLAHRGLAGLDQHGLATQHVAAGWHAGGRDRVGHQHDALAAARKASSTTSGATWWRSTISPSASRSSTSAWPAHAGLAVVQRALGVEQVGHGPRAGVRGGRDLGTGRVDCARR